MTTPTISHRPLAQRAAELNGSVIDASTALLASQTHDIVKFAMGAPNDELIPTEEFGRLLGNSADGRFGYGASEGEDALIEQILHIQTSQGHRSSADRIVVIGTEADVQPVEGMRGTIEVWDTVEPSRDGIEGEERMRLIRDDIAARVRTLLDDVRD